MPFSEPCPYFLFSNPLRFPPDMLSQGKKNLIQSFHTYFRIVADDSGDGGGFRPDGVSLPGNLRNRGKSNGSQLPDPSKHTT